MATAKRLPSGAWRALLYAGTDGDGKRKYETLKEEFENLSEKVGKIIIPIYDQD